MGQLQHIYDTDMWNRHNVHKMFINIYRNPKTRNWFRYETFIHLFEFKRFFDMRSERHNLSMLTAFTSLALNPTNAWRPLRIKSFGLAQLWISTLSFGGRKSTLCFFSNPQILSPRFRCGTSLTSPGPNSYLGFLFWHLWMTHPLRTRVNTCVNVCT